MTYSGLGVGTGTVTSVAVTGDANLTITGSPITTTGTIDLSLPSLSGTNTGDQDLSPYQLISGMATDVPANETDPVFTASDAASITATDITNLGNLSGNNSGDQDLWQNIAVTGQTTLTAASVTDTLTLEEGSNITITTDGGTNTVTIASSVPAPTVNAQTGTTYTLDTTDHLNFVTCSNASAITVTVDDTSLPTNFFTTIWQLGAGQVSFTAGGTAVLRNVSSQTKIAGQWGAVTIKRVGSGTDFIISGATGS